MTEDHTLAESAARRLGLFRARFLRFLAG